MLKSHYVVWLVLLQDSTSQCLPDGAPAEVFEALLHASMIAISCFKARTSPVVPSPHAHGHAGKFAQSRVSPTPPHVLLLLLLLDAPAPLLAHLGRDAVVRPAADVEARLGVVARERRRRRRHVRRAPAEVGHRRRQVAVGDHAGLARRRRDRDGRAVRRGRRRRRLGRLRPGRLVRRARPGRLRLAGLVRVRGLGLGRP